MITLVHCLCGLSHDAIAFACLELVRGGPQNHTRRCTCGREHTVSTLEGDAATEILCATDASKSAFELAAFEIFMQRQIKASGGRVDLSRFRELREEAKSERARAKELELALFSIIRSQAIRPPKSKTQVVRHLRLVVDNTADAAADTERSPRVGR